MTAAVFYARYDAGGASSRTRCFEYVQPLGEIGIDAAVVPRAAPGAFEQVLRRAEAGAVVVLQKPSLRVIADEPLAWPGAEFARWSAADEARLLAEADIGVMPLHDDERSGGRCGYPTEALGAGLLPASEAEWREAIATLAASPELRAELGAAGRRHVEARHSLGGNAARLAAIIRSCS